ncbi:MAG: SMP-30/gluconolactonase/LRE family protein [Blastomonas sp.]|nr:SMP-30/gluconolactonase/LRE family protein [Blastomonas sp.]
MTTVRICLDSADIVGESIVWDDRQECLFWVDIVGSRIHRFDPLTCDHQIWPTSSFVTSIGLRDDGGAIVGLRQHVALWDLEYDWTILAEPEAGVAGNRLNEGKVAPDGSFWVGTMQDNLNDDGTAQAQSRKTGHLYRIAPDGEVQQLSADAFGIPNTMIWLDHKNFVTADTPDNSLYAYTIADDGRSLCDRRVFSDAFPRGLPDGSCIDAEGAIWTCRVAGGAALTRMLPDGRLDQVVPLPCTWPTSCTFGGAGLETLFVTSARFTMTPEHLAGNPLEGAMFALDPGVTGVAEHRFGHPLK